MEPLRDRLVSIALEWQDRFGVAPPITSTLSELDAAKLVGMSEDQYARDCIGRTAVTRGYDFRHGGVRYQVKANRPSGKPGSPVTLVSKATNLEWDRLIWVLYDVRYRVAEAWMWDIDAYERQIVPMKRVGPREMRLGLDLLGSGAVRLHPAPSP